MTPEREKEIREWDGDLYSKELLAEINSLRRDLASAQIRALTYLKSCEGAQKEIDTLRSRIKKLRKALRYFSAAKRRTVFEILPDNKPINPTLMIEADNERAEKALAQDDEMEGK
jgi:predicted  nucleic acid-binding Zn-ribbon protein